MHYRACAVSGHIPMISIGQAPIMAHVHPEMAVGFMGADLVPEALLLPVQNKVGKCFEMLDATKL